MADLDLDALLAPLQDDAPCGADLEYDPNDLTAMLIPVLENRSDVGNIGTSAFDPIFWSHHVQIDRLWYLWQLKNGNDSIPQDYLGLPLAPFPLTVKDVLDIQQLGYSYGVASVGVSA